MINILRVSINKTPILLVLFSFSCKMLTFGPHGVYTTETKLEVVNNSDHKIKILAFHKSKLLDEIKLEQKQNYSRTVINYTSNNFFSDENSGLRDSILIIFDDKRAILQFCKNVSDLNCPVIEKHIQIMADSKYQVGKTKYNSRKEIAYSTFRYPITEEDYARAVPLEDLKKK